MTRDELELALGAEAPDSESVANLATALAEALERRRGRSASSIDTAIYPDSAELKGAAYRCVQWHRDTGTPLSKGVDLLMQEICGVTPDRRRRTAPRRPSERLEIVFRDAEWRRANDGAPIPANRLKTEYDEKKQPLDRKTIQRWRNEADYEEQVRQAGEFMDNILESIRPN